MAAARGRARALAAALACVLAAWAAVPAGAGAHAVVEATEPTRGAALERSPERVSVAFDEPVESSFGALRVFDADGERVDVGEVERPADDRVAVRVRDDLPDGAYTVTYRVVSADSHPVAGGYVFTVGEAGGVSAAAVSDLIDAGAGPATEIAFGAVRAVGYAAIALLAGGLAFLLLVWAPVIRRLPSLAPPPADVAAIPAGASAGTPAAAPAGGASGEPVGADWSDATRAFERRGTRLLIVAAVAGMVATALGIVLQAATATGGSFWSALDRGLIHDVLNTRFGDVWKLRFSAFGVLAALLLLGPRGNDRSRPGGAARSLWLLAFGAACAYLVVSPALGGHAGAGDDSRLLVPLDVAHVVAMSVWVGGVTALLLVVPAATRSLEPAQRTRLLAGLVRRFSTVALTAVALLLASGIAQSVLYLDSLSALVDTAFGRAVLVKGAIFAALVALGAHNRRRSQPALTRLAAGGAAPGRAGVVLRRALRAEVALMAAVLAVTAALVAYSPSAGEASGPYSTSADLGPARVELTVDPARAGSNEVHVYLFDARSGAQYDRARRLTIAARQPELDIGPLELDVRKAGPGHYTVARAELAPAGDWTLTLRAPVSAFEELRTTLEVPIR